MAVALPSCPSCPSCPAKSVRSLEPCVHIFASPTGDVYIVSTIGAVFLLSDWG